MFDMLPHTLIGRKLASYATLESFVAISLSWMSRMRGALRLTDERASSTERENRKGAKDVKYVLMMHAKGGPYAIAGWPKKDIQAHMAFMMGLDKDLRESGELVDGVGLTAPDQAKLVRAGKNGAPITDGVFPESKEFLVGYWTVDVETPQRAYEIAARASSAPGPGGAPLNMPIEVRQVMSAPPEELL
jgi:hypothetical protein